MFSGEGIAIVIKEKKLQIFSSTGILIKLLNKKEDP
jgi:hypothetical protein